MLDLLESVLRTVLRVAQGRKAEPSATIFDSRTLQSSPESGHRAGYLLGLHVTPASEQDRAQVAQLSQQVQATTGQSVEVAFVDQGYTGGQPAQDAALHGIRLEVVKLPEAKKGFVLLPRRWVVENTQPQYP